MAVVQPKPLETSQLNLSGRHLIEASAGTGKTYNITRLYLRFLLEREWTVKQILVMTFTKAATEELRGRIDKVLRETLENWTDLRCSDPFYQALPLTPEQEAKAPDRLKAALLELDEAAIYTIHGFCNRALTTQVFASKIPMDLAMEADTSELLLDAVRDWIRHVNQNEEQFQVLADKPDDQSKKNWHRPEVFLRSFRGALGSSDPLQAIEPEPLDDHPFLTDFHAQKKHYLANLRTNWALLQTGFIDQHEEGEALKQEWPLLEQWLENETPATCNTACGNFLKVGRYKAKAYAGIKQILRPVYEFKVAYNKAFKDYAPLMKQQRNAERAQLALQGIEQIRASFVRAKQQHAVMDFDDLITLLSRQLTDPAGESLVKGLRKQYPVALVDEFQDTDPHQYAILDALYPKTDTHHALFMIGDPKQAIYSFRGGDIFTYLTAKQQADHHWYMDTNWRSVEQMVTGYNRLFWGEPLELGTPAEVFGYDIGYEQIQHTEKAKANETPLSDPAERSAVNYVWLPAIEDSSGVNGAKHGDWQRGLARWCTAEIIRLLTEAKLGEEPLKERDIAILVRTGFEAGIIREMLSRHYVPSVYLSDRESIFESEQAQELLLVLKGILDCENDRLLTAALSTRLMGGSAEKLAGILDPGAELRWEENREWAFTLRELWREKGCLTLLMSLIRQTYQPGVSEHERALTNMIHLAELLQQASRQYQHPQQLLKWYTEQCEGKTTADEAILRLESDENLIRVVTQHGAKGLEYPVVFIPFAYHSRAPVEKKDDYFKFHDPGNYQPVFQIGHSDEAFEQATAEGRAESIRLLYVAITRAEHRCYLGVAPYKDSESSALGLALKVENTEDWLPKLHGLSDTSRKSSRVITIDSATAIPAYQHQGDMPGLPEADTLTRRVSSDWLLSSFSSLVKGKVYERQEKKERADEAVESISPETQAAPSPDLRFTLPKGIKAGNLLHDILEHHDFGSAHWDIEGPVKQFGGMDERDQARLEAWLSDCLSTPLPLAVAGVNEIRLKDLGWQQTLRETEFYFPMESMRRESLEQCLKQHRGGNEPVELPGYATLSGMMRGFIDLIFEHEGRFYVVDYKSTHLGNRLEDYGRERLKANNEAHFYDLQYLIYSLALHRYLGMRIRDYEPARHFGGVYYLYLRGMNPAPGNDYGVFHTAIEDALLQQLDALFNDDHEEVKP